VDFSLPSERVIRSLMQIISWRGKPQVIRCDNGPENISGKIQAWAGECGIRFEYIQPGKPQQNPDGQFKFPHPWPPQIPPGSTTRL
jgi:putative transposase